jgi:hypothetical protein
MTNIIDQYGAVSQQIQALEEIKSRLKAELLARGVGNYQGEEFTAEVLEYDRENISAPLVRKLSNEEFVKSVTTVQHIKAVVVKSLQENT